MIQAFPITREDEEVWNNLLADSINASYISSMAYAYTKESIGKNIETYVFKQNGKIIAGAHYYIKSYYKNIIKIADVQSGFLLLNEPDLSTLSNLLEHFIQWAKKKNATYIRFYSWLPASIANVETSFSGLIKDLVRRKGFKKIESPRHTYWINLQKNENELLMQMKRKTRYEIKQAQKSQLIVERHDKPNDELFETFWSLYNNLGQKKGFRILEKYQFKEEFFSLMESGLANLFVINCQDTIVNISFASNLGRASYLYGAMNPNFKELNCPSPGQIAQWEMIKFMKSKKISIYDMGFCPGAIPFPEHPEYPIWRFKYGFGGDHVEFLPTYGKILKPIRGKIFQYLKY